MYRYAPSYVIPKLNNTMNFIYAGEVTFEVKWFYGQ